MLAPDLPLQVERQRGQAAATLLIAHPVDGLSVFAAAPEACRAGVQVGMPLRQARQLLPSAVVVAPDELAYHARHAALQAALRAFSPALETAGLGEVLVDARGLERLFESEAALAQALSREAGVASGLSVQVGLAEGKFTAQQAARHAPPGGICVVPAGGEAAFLDPLSLSALPALPAEAARRLQLFEVSTLGRLAALGKSALLRQFGQELAEVYELARGRDPRPVNPDVPPLRVVRALRLAGPVAERAILLNATARLARRLGETLNACGHHAEALKLSLLDEAGCSLEAGQAVRPPTADAARLRFLAAHLLERISPRAPILSLSLSAYPLRPWHLGQHQLALIESGLSARRTRLEELLQLLAHRFGESMLRVAALFGPPRPVRIEVSLGTDGQPAWLAYAGQVRRVALIDERWREEHGWWDRPVRREYVRVVLADGTLRNLFLDPSDGEWYLDRAWPLL